MSKKNNYHESQSPKPLRLLPAPRPHIRIPLHARPVLWGLPIVFLALYAVIGAPGIADNTWTRRLLLQPTKLENESVLGASLRASQEKSRSELNTEIAKWRAIVHDHPDFRDGYVMLVTLCYQLGRFSEGREFLQKVENLDPNYPELEKLRSLLGVNER